jgi:hypothetical protein
MKRKHAFTATACCSPFVAFAPRDWSPPRCRKAPYSSTHPPPEIAGRAEVVTNLLKSIVM